MFEQVNVRIRENRSPLILCILYVYLKIVTPKSLPSEEQTLRFLRELHKYRQPVMACNYSNKLLIKYLLALFLLLLFFVCLLLFVSCWKPLWKAIRGQPTHGNSLYKICFLLIFSAPKSLISPAVGNKALKRLTSRVTVTVEHRAALRYSVDLVGGMRAEEENDDSSLSQKVKAFGGSTNTNRPLPPRSCLTRSVSKKLTCLSGTTDPHPGCC